MEKTNKSVYRLGDGQQICSECWEKENSKSEPETGWTIGVCDFCDDQEIVEEAENQEPETLEELLAQLKSGALDNSDWSSLPIFGGDEPSSTVGVWSWDATRLLIGTCADDMEIVNRADR